MKLVKSEEVNFGEKHWTCVGQFAATRSYIDSEWWFRWRTTPCWNGKTSLCKSMIEQSDEDGSTFFLLEDGKLIRVVRNGYDPLVVTFLLFEPVGVSQMVSTVGG